MTNDEMREYQAFFEQKKAQRIDSRTVIYVTHDKATPEYAQQYLNKIKGIKDEQD